jgi:6-phosphogluconolactonase
MAQKTLLYVGTYTRPAPYLASTNGKGIYVYSLNRDTGELTYLSEIEGIDNPSFLAIDPQKRHLYATSEVWGWHEGLVTAFKIDPETGALSYLNKQSTLGSITAYVTVESTNRYLLLVNYWDRQSVAMFPIQADGSLAPASFSVEHTEPGAKVDPARQDKSHAHCIVPDPTNTYAMVADLGLDKIMIYRMDLEAGKLIPHTPPFLKMNPGAGPRHFVFHPSGKFAYVIEELASSIAALAYDSTKGTLEWLQSVPALPEGFDGHSHCSDIQVTPDGRFLYGGNRGHDSLVIYAIDPSSGKLSYVGHQSTLGQTPRNFAIDPTGTFLLAANQDSDTIVTFRIDRETGLLHETGFVAEVPTPVCLKMIQV